MSTATLGAAQETNKDIEGAQSQIREFIVKTLVKSDAGMVDGCVTLRQHEKPGSGPYRVTRSLMFVFRHPAPGMKASQGGDGEAGTIGTTRARPERGAQQIDTKRKDFGNIPSIVGGWRGKDGVVSVRVESLCALLDAWEELASAGIQEAGKATSHQQ